MRRIYTISAAALLLMSCGMEPLTNTSAPATEPLTSGAETTPASPAETTANTTDPDDRREEPEPNSSDLTTEQTTQTELTTTTLPQEPKLGMHGKLIENVPHYDQTSGYATACESLAAVELMEYYGTKIDPGVFIGEYLPIADYPDSDRYGNLHAESPWDYFIGDPLKSNGYGCYSPVIVKAIEASPFPGTVAALRDIPLKTLCSDYIDNGDPVIIWASIEMQPTRAGHTWYLPTGEKFTFTRPEHALVLIGYDDDCYFFSDSLSPTKATAYPRDAVETAYKAMQMQAVTLNTQINAAPETDIPEETEAQPVFEETEIPAEPEINAGS